MRLSTLRRSGPGTTEIMFRGDIFWLIPAANVFMILNDLKSYSRLSRPVRSLSFSRPVVLFHSDDWGLVGIRDQEGFDRLCSRGLDLGNEPYDFYSLETAEDLHRLYEVLRQHRDSVGRPPCFVLQFCSFQCGFCQGD